MTAIAKSAKRHLAAKKCCGWEEPVICPYESMQVYKYASIQLFNYSSKYLRMWHEK